MKPLRIAALLLVVPVIVAGVYRAAQDEPEPRHILNRLWFDSLPRTPRDDIKLLLFLAGGLGIHHRGSAFLNSVELFEFERQGDKLAISFLQDRARTNARFKVTACDEKPPFNLCLDLAPSPRGPNRYYGFASDRELTAHIAWGEKLLLATRAQAEIR